MSDLVEVKTIGEVERIVHGSGLWDGTTAVEFSNDGGTWSETWAPSEEFRYPAYARVSVYRKEVRIPTAVTIRWDEQLPKGDEFWLAKWFSAPMRHFGRTARMVAFRQTFRDLLGDIAIEDEDRGASAPEEPAPRDWAAEIAETVDLDALNVLEKEARKARVFTPDAAGTALHRALRDRRREIALISTATSVAAASAAPVADVTEALDKITADHDPALDGLSSPARAPRAPQDYLPGNRAARRKKKRGGRR